MALLGVTSLTGCNSIPQFIAGTADVGASASRTVFRMATSPVSWTKDTTAFDGTLRITNGASLSPGGSVNFPIVFSASSPLSVTLAQNSISATINQAAAFPNTTNTGDGGGGTLSPVTLALTQMGPHSHPYITPTSATATAGTQTGNITIATSSENTGGYGAGGSHTHNFAGHTHSLGPISQHSHSLSGQHSHTISSTQNFEINYVDMIISVKD